MHNRRNFISKSLVLLVGATSMNFFSSCQKEFPDMPSMSEGELMKSLLRKGNKIFVESTSYNKEILKKRTLDIEKKEITNLIDSRNTEDYFAEQTENVVIGSLMFLDDSTRDLLKLQNVKLIQDDILFYAYSSPKFLKINKNIRHQVKIVDQIWIQ